MHACANVCDSRSVCFGQSVCVCVWQHATAQNLAQPHAPCGTHFYNPRCSVQVTACHLSAHVMSLLQVDFGTLYFGETAKRTYTLFNNGPAPAKYILR